MTIFSASMAPGESKDERDERVARLWQTLDTRKEGHIDLNGLKKGLKKIDHREFPNPISCRELPINAPIAALKHADGLVQSILREVDTNSDGRIDYDGNDPPFLQLPVLVRGAYALTFRSLLMLVSEFRAFINHTESGLWQMFQSIDRNHNGEIDKNELRTAFSQSGVTVSSAKLDNFFAEVDKNNDGVISYAEWRCETPPTFFSSWRLKVLKDDSCKFDTNMYSLCSK